METTQLTFLHCFHRFRIQGNELQEIDAASQIIRHSLDLKDTAKGSVVVTAVEATLEETKKGHRYVVFLFDFAPIHEHPKFSLLSESNEALNLYWVTVSVVCGCASASIRVGCHVGIGETIPVCSGCAAANWRPPVPTQRTC